MKRRVYIGWDPREDIAYQVCKHSIHRLSNDIEVLPLKLDELKSKGLVTRPDDPKASTQFTFTRFLVPYLNGYEGWAVFIDCDFLARNDVNKLFDLADDRYAVQVVKHDYNVADGVAKMDGQVQHAYPRKNWSSCMLFNCSHPKNKQYLYPEFMNKQEMSYLHRLQWLDNNEIGELPIEWNYLVGHYNEVDHGKPSFIHYTLGMPFMPGYEDCEYSNAWYEERADFIKSW
jgi:lipopolysaccharide biosynthesis glycosyltransferase